MSYEQSHTVGKKTKPIRKKKKDTAPEFDQHEEQAQPIGAPPQLLELQDHRSTVQPIAAGPRNEINFPDNASTVAERLRSPTSSD